MNISTLIKKLEEYKKQHGDVVLYSQKGDGHSSWNSPINFVIEHANPWPQLKQKQHYLNVTSGW